MSLGGTVAKGANPMCHGARDRSAEDINEEEREKLTELLRERGEGSGLIVMEMNEHDAEEDEPRTQQA